MNISHILLWFAYNVHLVVSLHLNTHQMGWITSLLQNQQINVKEKETVQMVLYKSYEKLAIKKAVEFKRTHKHKCHNIQNAELIWSSKIGLFKAIQKYNGLSDFNRYSEIYMRSELLKVLTDAYSLSSLPKRIRTKSKPEKGDIGQTLTREKYNNLLHINLSVTYEPWQIDTIFVKNDGEDESILERMHKKYELSEALNSQPPFKRRTLYLKYLLHDNRILSNRHVSELMCCSEEAVRKSVLYHET
jgi:RNA polymerase sigma factor (sigma-70 family)